MVSIFSITKRIIAGSGSINCLSAELQNFNVNKVLIITDKGLKNIGIDRKILRILAKSKLNVDIWSDIEGEPTAATVDELANIIKQSGFEIILGLGGGSAMDLAKGAAVMACNEGSIKNYVGIDKIPKPGLPLVLIPTTSGTGSEVTKNAIFFFKEEMAKMGVVSELFLPQTAIVDPELTISCPPEITAATGMDALIHAIESFTSKKATPHTEMYAIKAIKLISKNLREAVFCGDNLKSRENMGFASLFAGISLNNAGVGAVHALAYPLGGSFNISHGMSNTMLLVPVLEYNIKCELEKFALIAEVLGETIIGKNLDEAALLCIKALRELIVDIGITSSLREMGVVEEDLDDLSASAEKQERLLANNPCPLSKSDIKAIYSSIM